MHVFLPLQSYSKCIPALVMWIIYANTVGPHNLKCSCFVLSTYLNCWQQNFACIPSCISVLQTWLRILQCQQDQEPPHSLFDWVQVARAAAPPQPEPPCLSPAAHPSVSSSINLNPAIYDEPNRLSVLTHISFSQITP